MSALISETRPRARKEHSCQAYAAITEYGINHFDFTPEESALLEQWKLRKGKILKGEVYRRQCVELEGEIMTWVASIPMAELYFKYELNAG